MIRSIDHTRAAEAADIAPRSSRTEVRVLEVIGAALFLGCLGPAIAGIVSKDGSPRRTIFFLAFAALGEALLGARRWTEYRRQSWLRKLHLWRGAIVALVLVGLLLAAIFTERIQ